MDQLIPNMMTSQMLGMAMMKDNISIMQLMGVFLLMQLYALIPQFKQMLTVYINKKLIHVKNTIQDKTVQIKSGRDIKSKITFIKNSKKKDSGLIIEAINYHITNIETSKYLTYINGFYVTNNEEFEISKEIYCQALANISVDEEEEQYTLDIYSYSKSLHELKIYVEKLREKYVYEQNNKLGNKKFFFDEHHITLPKEINGDIRFASAPPNMTFKMTQFNTNKSLNNIFGSHLDVVKKRIDLFINNPRWYEDKGIPYTLGIMLHGPPGTGKTSLIKALAKDTRRHIFNIKLYSDTTQTQLRTLFFNESVYVLNNNKTETYNIPLDERIYVIEDIDCLTDIVKDRALSDTDESKMKEKRNQHVDNTLAQIPSAHSQSQFGRNNVIIDNYTEKPKQANNESINLSFLLNLLDGILETPGRILIMTTNKPDVLDKALIRPGRIDLNIEVGYCTIEMIKEMFTFFFNTKKEYEFNVNYTNKLTPAELNKILLDNIESEEKCYLNIINKIN